MKHDGVVFPEFRHQKIPFIYRGKRIPIDVYGELYLILFMKHKDKHTDAVFVRNFLTSLSSYIGHPIKSIRDIDTKAFMNATIKRKKQPNVSNIVTIRNKKYTYNPYIEPPSIFIGRGEHPKRGTIKRPVCSRDVSLNTSNNVPWVAKYIDQLTNEPKYIMIKGVRDELDKYETARKLHRKLKKLRHRVNQDLKKGDERATCVAIIDATCMRAGVEKDTNEEADTVGCCSLRVDHVTLLSGHTIRFRFPGKDSILWDTCMKNPYVYANMKKLMRNKKKDDAIFTVNPCQVNHYIQSIIPGVSAKCFRTCHASGIMSRRLACASSVDEFKEANKAVAKKLCHMSGNTLSCATSKTNYIDPRVTYSWCRKHNIPIQKVYSKVLLEKHEWASSTSENFIY
jgi:DNA topoisomerase I